MMRSCLDDDNTSRPHRTTHYLLVLSQAERVVATVEGDELGLEEDVTVDAEVALGGLDATKAGC